MTRIRKVGVEIQSPTCISWWQVWTINTCMFV